MAHQNQHNSSQKETIYSKPSKRMYLCFNNNTMSISISKYIKTPTNDNVLCMQLIVENPASIDISVMLVLYISGVLIINKT